MLSRVMSILFLGAMQHFDGECPNCRARTYQGWSLNAWRQHWAQYSGEEWKMWHQQQREQRQQHQQQQEQAQFGPTRAAMGASRVGPYKEQERTDEVGTVAAAQQPSASSSMEQQPLVTSTASTVGQQLVAAMLATPASTTATSQPCGGDHKDLEANGPDDSCRDK